MCYYNQYYYCLNNSSVLSHWHIFNILSQGSFNESFVVLFLLGYLCVLLHILIVVERVDILGLKLTALCLHDGVLLSHHVVSIILDAFLLQLV